MPKVFAGPWASPESKETFSAALQSPGIKADIFWTSDHRNDVMFLSCDSVGFYSNSFSFGYSLLYLLTNHPTLADDYSKIVLIEPLYISNSGNFDSPDQIFLEQLLKLISSCLTRDYRRRLLGSQMCEVSLS